MSEPTPEVDLYKTIDKAIRQIDKALDDPKLDVKTKVQLYRCLAYFKGTAVKPVTAAKTDEFQKVLRAVRGEEEIAAS